MVDCRKSTETAKGKIMKSMKKVFLPVAILTAVLVSPAQAVPISGHSALSSFTGSLTYSFLNATHAIISFVLNNTSSAVTGGYMTGFLYNNPGNNITGVSLSSSNSNFTVIGGPTFQNGIDALSFGRFDIGTSSGGVATHGIAPGTSATFDFSLTGAALDTLNEWSFVNEFSSGSSKGEQFFNGRFNGFFSFPSLTDKVPGTVTPEPFSGALFLIGSAALAGRSLRRKKGCFQA